MGSAAHAQPQLKWLQVRRNGRRLGKARGRYGKMWREIYICGTTRLNTYQQVRSCNPRGRIREHRNVYEQTGQLRGTGVKNKKGVKGMGKGPAHEGQYSENKSLRIKEAQKYRTDCQNRGIKRKQRDQKDGQAFAGEPDL